MTARAERFARQLAGRFGLAGGARRRAVYDAWAPKRRSRRPAYAGAARRAARDAVAAQLILQSWLDDDRAKRHPWRLPDAEQTLAALADRMRGAVAFDARFVGIYSGGAWIAERLAQMIAGDHPVGYIDVSFYRDDFSRTGLKPEVKRTDLPFEVEGATIVLVDDVLYTGRSVRAAINELFDFGRPASGRARGARRPRRPRAADRADLRRRAARRRARPLHRPVARGRRQARPHHRGRRCVTRSSTPTASSRTS